MQSQKIIIKKSGDKLKATLYFRLFGFLFWIRENQEIGLKPAIFYIVKHWQFEYDIPLKMIFGLNILTQ